VFGETKAGKSLFLNLLLGMNKIVLPSKEISCSSTICEISYGEYRLKIPNGTTIQKNQMSDEEWKKKKLNFILAKEGEDRVNMLQNFQAKVVSLDVPSNILKDGVILVDSPGLSEKVEFDQQVSLYTPKAMCMFVLINCTDGCLKTSLQNLLYSLKEKEFFDPKRLFFVCTKVDQIQNWEVMEKKFTHDINSIFQNLEVKLHPINLAAAFRANCLRLETVEWKQLKNRLVHHIGSSYKFKVANIYARVREFIDIGRKPLLLFSSMKGLTAEERREKRNDLEDRIKDLEIKVKKRIFGPTEDLER